MVFRFHFMPVLAGMLLLSVAGLIHVPFVHAEEKNPASVVPIEQKGQPALPGAAVRASSATLNASSDSTMPGGDIYGPWVGKKFQRGPANEKKIALTFDDGPNPRTTPRVVEILKQAGVTATFFWIGDMVAKNPSTAKLVQNSGFEFGSHTYTHKNLRAISADAARQEIISAQDIIQQVTGIRPRLFRPPYGNINPNVIKIAQDDKLVMVMWAVDSNDWHASMNPDKVLERVSQLTHPGAVILLHDIQEKTVQALPRLIADLKAKGYQFVTVSQLMDEANKHPEALS